MADPSIRLLHPDLRARLLRAIDVEARVPAALQALGPITERDVVVVGATDESSGGTLSGHLLGLGGWIRTVPDLQAIAALPDARADVLVASWTGFAPGSPDWDAHLADARRVLRPDGRLLVLHDYGRDEVSGLVGDDARASERVAWSRPNGPFLGHGFRIRVLHCWWTWDTLEEATELLTACFGDAGAAVAASMRRPRLAWKVAVYHLAMDLEVSTGVVADSPGATATKRVVVPAAIPASPG